MGHFRQRALAAAALVVFSVAPAAAQDAILSGHWTIDRALSRFPPDLGFNAPFVADSPEAATARGRGRSRQSAARAPLMPESQDDANRLQQLTAEARSPAVNLAIVDTPVAVTITDEQDRSRAFHPTAKEDIVQLDKVPVAAVATRSAGHLTVVYQVEDGRQLRYTYSATANPPQLLVDVTFIERGIPADAVRRVYVPGTASLPPARASAASGGPSDAPQASAPTGPDAELKGLTKLGVVIEDLTSQAASCGLKAEPIAAMATQSLTDAGLTVLRTVSSNDNTYLYVYVVTTHVNADLCVSKYDASIYTHTTTRLPYGTSPVPVQVLLLHNGGLAGGSPANHGESVVSGLKGYVDQFGARIRAANPQ